MLHYRATFLIFAKWEHLGQLRHTNIILKISFPIKYDFTNKSIFSNFPYFIKNITMCSFIFLNKYFVPFRSDALLIFGSVKYSLQQRKKGTDFWPTVVYITWFLFGYFCHTVFLKLIPFSWNRTFYTERIIPHGRNANYHCFCWKRNI